jgi:hypothetical protein
LEHRRSSRNRVLPRRAPKPEERWMRFVWRRATMEADRANVSSMSYEARIGESARLLGRYFVRNCLGSSVPSHSEAYRMAQGTISPREHGGRPDSPVPTAGVAGHSWLNSRQTIRRSDEDRAHLRARLSRRGGKGEEKRKERRMGRGRLQGSHAMKRWSQLGVRGHFLGLDSGIHWSGYLLDTPHLIPPH